MEYKVSEDVAQAQLDAMEAEFGGIDSSAAETVFDAIRRGLVEFDEQSGAVTYHLQRPPQIDATSFDTSRVELREPGAAEMEKIGKGLTVTATQDGTMQMDSSFMVKQTLRIITYVGGWPEGIAAKIKRRDLQVLQGLSNFFA